jgi:1,4-dihydroxy-2-naphthoate octaprenyltransferase/chlorophyll synthase
MDFTVQSTFDRWIYALKPMSWAKLLVPMILGQGLGLWAGTDISLTGMAYGAFYTVLDLVFIVLLNDWGDRRVDAIKREMFPDGCSPKTIPDGILPGRALLVVGLLAGVLAAGSGFIFEAWVQRPGIAVMGLAGLVMFGAYTFGPFKLNYRGGGEFIEMLGVGAVLPWLNAYAVGGVVWASSYSWVLGGFTLMAFSSALASGLADEDSDRAGGKRTFTTMFGNPVIRSWVGRTLVLGITVWLAMAVGYPELRIPALLAGLVAFYFHRRMSRVSHQATTNAFGAQKIFKLMLHRAIWWGGTIFGLTLGVLAFLG